jgi:D-alanine-D-alanine ligase
MKIGISYDLKSDPAQEVGLPDDFFEEFDSPVTIEAIASVLRNLGHEVVKLGDGRKLLERLLADPPDFVFNMAEGQGIGRSREARVPAVLEMLGIPYTGSDPLTLAVTLDKDCAKRLVASAGVKVPQGVVVESSLQIANCKLQIANLPFPVIVKPAWEGSSKGIRATSLVEKRDSLRRALAALHQDHRQPVLVEEYIQGDELTVGIIGNAPPEILGMMRVLPRETTDRFVYSLEVKRDYLRQVRYESPPQLPAADIRAIEQAALTAYRVLGCRDAARVDFRFRDGIPYFLEVNPLPGLNPESSDLVIVAKLCGWSYDRLISTIFQAARDRQGAIVK